MNTTTAVTPKQNLGEYGDTFKYVLDVVVSTSSDRATATNTSLSLRTVTWADDQMVATSDHRLDLSVEQLAHIHKVIGVALDLHAQGYLDTLVSDGKVLEPKLDTETE